MATFVNNHLVRLSEELLESFVEDQLFQIFKYVHIKKWRHLVGFRMNNITPVPDSSEQIKNQQISTVISQIKNADEIPGLLKVGPKLCHSKICFEHVGLISYSS